MTTPQKTVHVLPSKVTSNATLQALYLDRTTSTLIPNRVFLNEEGEILFQTNGLGLRGPDPEPGQRLAVVWGDSVVFSEVGLGWPEQIGDASFDCVFLNGGIEGSAYEQTLQRALDFNQKHDVALNLLMVGWYPYPGNQTLGADLKSVLAQIPNPVLITQPTSLNAAIASTDISAFFRRTLEHDRYHFFGNVDYSVALQLSLFHHICERNTIVRDVAGATSTPLIDLFTALDSSQADDFRKYFFDVSHPRPAYYPQIASLVREGIRPLLQRPRALGVAL